MPAPSRSVGTRFTLCIPEHPRVRAGGTAGGPLCLQEGAGSSPPQWVAGAALLDKQPGKSKDGWSSRDEGARSRRPSLPQSLLSWDRAVPPGWGTVNTGAVGRRDGTLRAPGVHAGQGGGSGYLEMYFLCFHSAAYIFPSFNVFCSHSQVKNSFHEPEPAAAALRPAVGTGDWPGTVPLHPSSSCSSTGAWGPA